ncbi:MAG: SRPBCC domain-containing protein, partial [Chloroflexota bacterium]
MSSLLKDFSVTRVFDAPVEDVWRAWSDADQVMRWWGPTGFTSPTCRMDFREGGTTIVHMRAPADFGGQDFYNTWTYSKIVPMQRIEFIQNFADQDGKRISPADAGLSAEIPEDVRSLVTFRALDDHHTEIT